MTLWRIDAPHFCAGLIVGEDGRVVEAAPILRWTIGKSLFSVASYCDGRGWKRNKLTEYGLSDSLPSRSTANRKQETDTMGMFDFPPQNPTTTNQNQPQTQQYQQPAPPQNFGPPPQLPQNFGPPPGYPTPNQSQPPAPFGGYPPPQGAQPYGQPAQPYGQPAQQPADYDDFDGINEAAQKQGGTRYPQFFSDQQCSHIAVIDKIAWKKTRNGPFMYLAELRVVVSTNPRVSPGAPRTYMEKQGKEGWDGRIARFIMGALGIPGKDVDKAGTRATFSDAQPLTGILVAVDIAPAASKKGQNGEPFMNVNFRPLSAAEFQAAAGFMQQLDPAWKPNQLQPSIRFAQQPPR